MKKILVLAGLVLVGVVGWRVAEQLSADAIGMALGILFGVLASLPAAILVLAAGRRRQEEEPAPQGRQGRNLPQPYGYGAYPQQPPVIVLAGGAPPQQSQTHYGDPQARAALPGPTAAEEPRRFKVVGEKEEWIDEW